MSPIHTITCLLLFGAFGCSVVSPPPVTPIHRVPQPLDEGTVTLSLVGGFAGGIFVDNSFGGLLRIGYQHGPSTQLGLDLLAGHSRAPDDDDDEPEVKNRPSWLFGARLWTAHVPNEDATYFAARAGLGYQFTDTGIHTITGDLALHLGGSAGEHYDGYLAPTGAISIPLRRGRFIEMRKRNHTEASRRRPATTYYFGLDVAGGISDQEYGAMLGMMPLVGGGEDGGMFALLSASGTRMID